MAFQTIWLKTTVCYQFWGQATESRETMFILMWFSYSLDLKDVESLMPKWLPVIHRIDFKVLLLYNLVPQYTNTCHLITVYKYYHTIYVPWIITISSLGRTPNLACIIITLWWWNILQNCPHIIEPTTYGRYIRHSHL